MSDKSYLNYVVEAYSFRDSPQTKFYALPDDTELPGGFDPDQSILAPEVLPPDAVELDSDFEKAERILALRTFLDDFTGNGGIFETRTECVFTLGSGIEYLVVNDDEADRLFEKEVTGSINEDIRTKVPDYIQQYIDMPRLIDAVKSDRSRGAALATEDGLEQFVKLRDSSYYIYRKA